VFEYEQELQLMIYYLDYLYVQAEEIKIKYNQRKIFIDLPFLKLNQQAQMFLIGQYLKMKKKIFQ
jgi:hypothetical protein